MNILGFKAGLSGKKTFAKRIICIFAVLIVLLLSGCKGKGPYVQSTSSKESSSNAKSNASVPKYINGDELAKASYELCFLLAQSQFSSPNNMSVNALVQYSFCRLYYKSFTDMENSKGAYRKASFDDIKAQIEKDFGTVSTDIKTSYLYNSGEKCFEMWEPKYATKIYYDVEIIPSGSNTYKAHTTFYTDKSKSEVKAKAILTVKGKDGHAVISKLSSSI